MEKVLTPSLEDYLKTIWEISLKKKTVRVKDIIKQLGYKVSSVVNALAVLKKHGFIIHEKYGYIELTYEGVKRAKDIYERHKKLTFFFTKVLNVKNDIAVQDACNIEHYLHKETYQNLIKFLNYINDTEEFSKDWLNDFKKYSKKKLKEKRSKSMKLSELKAGDKARIKKITGDINIKQRLLSMGVLPNENIAVEKVAPLGDPIDISIKSYHLTLRKSEADLIIVEKL